MASLEDLTCVVSGVLTSFPVITFSRQNVVNSMFSTINADCWTMQFALFSLVKKMDIDHPYHTIFQLLALANGDRTKEKQCSGISFVYWPKIVSLMRENGNVVPFTLSASVLEWVDGTLPLGEYLIRSRNGGAHGRYGLGDWSFLRCREHMTNEKDKCKAFHGVSENFRTNLPLEKREGKGQETDDDLETILEDSQDECEGNKDATHALMRVKQKLDGYEEGEMRNVRGQ
ncbi:serine/threonine-protein kinase atm, partial [Quercus suber]